MNQNDHENSSKQSDSKDESKEVNINQNNQADSLNGKLTRKCWLCFGAHRLMECDQFVKKSIPDRKKIAEQEQLCYNCLSKGHMLKECKSKYTCKVDGCAKKHHTMLHIENRKVNSNVNTQNSAKEYNKTYLQVLPVIVSNGQYYIETNALLDTGSYSTLIRQDVADKLNLSGTNHPLELSNVMSISNLATPLPISGTISAHANRGAAPFFL